MLPPKGSSRLPLLPIAKQLVVLEHETVNSSPFGGPVGLGLGRIVHRGAAAPDGGAAVTTAPTISETATTTLPTFRAMAPPAICRAP